MDPRHTVTPPAPNPVEAMNRVAAFPHAIVRATHDPA